MQKKVSKLNVAIKQKNNVGKPKGINTQLFKKQLCIEREIFGFDRPFKQRTFFSPEKRNLVIEIINGKKLVSSASIKIEKHGTESFASIGWKQTDKIYQNNGLMTQVLSEALYILKKSGVKGVSAQVIGGLGIYKKMGFFIKHKFGETYVYKELNPQVRQ